MAAIRLSDDLREDTGTGGDWKFSENSTSTGLTTGGNDGASITFTPSQSSDWLVFARSRIEFDAAGNQVGSRIVRSGETTSSDPSFRQEGEDSGGTDVVTFTNMRVFSCSTVSNTFKEQSLSFGGNVGTRSHSGVFALNLNKLRNRTSDYAVSGQDLVVTPLWTNLQTTTIQPQVPGDVFIFASFNYDCEGTMVYCTARLQVDSTDDPTTQFDDAYQRNESWDPDDELPWQRMTVRNLDTTLHTINVDGHTETAVANRAAKHRSIVAFTMELASRVIDINLDGTADYTSLKSALSAEGGNRKYVLAPGKYSEFDIDASHSNIAIEGSGIISHSITNDAVLIFAYFNNDLTQIIMIIETILRVVTLLVLIKNYVIVHLVILYSTLRQSCNELSNIQVI